MYSEKYLIYVPNQEQEGKAFEIFQLFRGIIKGIFDNLPENPKFIDSERTVIFLFFWKKNRKMPFLELGPRFHSGRSQ